MSDAQKVLWQHIDGILPVATSHGIGEKRVIAKSEEVGCGVTQISKTVLRAGEYVEPHMHPTMVEHFFFLSGQCEVIIEGGNCYPCIGGDYLFIPAGCSHQLRVNEETEMITIGIATCSKNISE